METPNSLRFRRILSMPGLLEVVRACFERIPDPFRHRSPPLVDHLMAVMAIFFLKVPYMLDLTRPESGLASLPDPDHNFKTLFGIGCLPTDTSLRKRLDEVDPQALRSAFKAVFSEIQRGGDLEKMPAIDGHFLVSIQSTEYFRSRTIECKSCCQRNLRGGEIESFHQMVFATMIAPDAQIVLPFMPEMVLKSDGEKKNDRESNATRRLLPGIRREHPHLKICSLIYRLHFGAQQVRLMRELGMNFIIGAKRSDHKFLYEQLDIDGESCEIESTDGIRQVFRWRNGAELDDSSPGLWTNVLECHEKIPERRLRKAGGKVRIEPARERTFGWITDIEIRPDRLIEVMRAGRSRCRVENEAFDTLKSFDSLEHSYGHGNNRLASVMPTIMLLEYLVENALILCCPVFGAVRRTFHARTAMSWRLKGGFLAVRLEDWEHLMRAAAPELSGQMIPPDPKG